MNVGQDIADARGSVHQEPELKVKKWSLSEWWKGRRHGDSQPGGGGGALPLPYLHAIAVRISQSHIGYDKSVVDKLAECTKLC